MEQVEQVQWIQALGWPSRLQGSGTPSFPGHRKHRVGEAFLWPLDINHLPLGVAEG